MLTKTQISTGQYSGDGSPWVLIATKSSINLDTLEYSSDGSPWYGVEEVSSVASFLPIIMWFD